MKILSVDDSEANLFVVRQLVEPLGYAVVDATSGDQALVRAAEQEFALFLLDVRMPGLDGLATLERLRATANHPETPAILITAAGWDGDRAERAFSLGAIDYLEKPIPPEVLRGKVRTMVALYESNRALRARDAALAMKDRHLAVLAHDLRTPLGTILGAAQLLLRGLPSPSARVLGERIVKSAHRMEAMVTDILDQARDGGGQFPMAPTPTDAGLLARELVDDLESGRAARNITLDLDGDLRGEWDPARLRQAVTNLLDNAAQHGQGLVRLSVRGGESHVELAVFSDGPPIPAELLSQLTQPFKRGSRGGDGVGLGLYIVDQIARLHRGTLTVTPAEDGNTFVIRIPRKPF